MTTSKRLTAWYSYMPPKIHWSLDNEFTLCSEKIHPDWTDREQGSTLIWCRLCNALKAEIESRVHADAMIDKSKAVSRLEASQPTVAHYSSTH